MKKIFITITGTKYYHGTDFLEPKMKVRLIKDPNNKYDKEAIKVEMDGIGQIGHVANSPYTVVGESMSAGRLYDRIGHKATATILYVLPIGVLCEVDRLSLRKTLDNWRNNDRSKGHDRRKVHRRNSEGYL